MVDLVPAANFDWLSNLGKVIQEKQQKEALKQAYATPGLSPEEMARRVGAAGDGAGAMNLLQLGELQKQHAAQQAHQSATLGVTREQLAESIRQHQATQAQQAALLEHQRNITSPEHAARTKTAEAEVAEKYAPKTTDISLPDGTKVTVQKTSTGYTLPTVTGLETAGGVETPPGMDPKKLREARSTAYADLEKSAIERLNAANSIDPLLTRAETAYKALGERNAIGPVSASAPVRMANSIVAGTKADILGGGASEKLRQDYEAAAKGLELIKAQISMKGQGQITESERKILALTLPTLNAADPQTGLDTLAALRKEVAAMRTEAESYKPKPKARTASGGLPVDPAVLEEAKAAIATGKITRDEAINRLVKGGFNPSGL